MLEFLGSLGNIANTISSVAGPVNSIINAIRGPQKVNIPAPKQPASEAYAISLLKALAEPGNSLVKSLAAEELRNLMGGMQSDIRSRVLADRRERSMGRAPVFFDPERADENIAFQISRGGAGLVQQAQNNAIARIMQAAGVGKFAPGEYGRSQDYQAALGAAREADINNPAPSTIDRITSGLSGLDKILQTFNTKNAPTSNTGYGGMGPYPMSYNMGNEDIRWNQMRY